MIFRLNNNNILDKNFPLECFFFVKYTMHAERLRATIHRQFSNLHTKLEVARVY